MKTPPFISPIKTLSSSFTTTPTSIKSLSSLPYVRFANFTLYLNSSDLAFEGVEKKSIFYFSKSIVANLYQKGSDSVVVVAVSNSVFVLILFNLVLLLTPNLKKEAI